jgi:hypothetical protein
MDDNSVENISWDDEFSQNIECLSGQDRFSGPRSHVASLRPSGGAFWNCESGAAAGPCGRSTLVSS